MSCYAALDIGSNSVRLLVGEVQDGKVLPLLRELRSTRLLAGAKDGWLRQEAVTRTVAAVSELLAIAQAYSPAATACIATSAVREARNPELLKHELVAKTGLQATVIAGDTEARLAYRGALAGLKQPFTAPLVIDIGGGSTEISWQGREGICFSSSPVGAVRVMEGGLSRTAVRRILAPTLAGGRRASPDLIITTGGTVTTLAAMELGLRVYNPDLVHGSRLTFSRVIAWERHLATLPLAEKKKIPGLQPERADIIGAGVMILAVILEELAASSFIVSEADLLWGMLLAQAERGELHV